MSRDPPRPSGDRLEVGQVQWPNRNLGPMVEPSRLPFEPQLTADAGVYSPLQIRVALSVLPGLSSNSYRSDSGPETAHRPPADRSGARNPPPERCVGNAEHGRICLSSVNGGRSRFVHTAVLEAVQ